MLRHELAQELRDIEIDVDNARMSHENYDSKDVGDYLDKIARKISVLLDELDGTNNMILTDNVGD